MSSLRREQNARDVRARAWRYIFECYAKKKAAAPGRPVRGGNDDSSTASSIQHA